MTTDLSFLSTKKALVSHETAKFYKDGDIYTKYETYFIT